MSIYKFKHPALCFIAGWLSLLAMPPWGLWPAMFIGLSGFYLLLNKAETKKQAFAYGWLFAMGYFLPGLAWIGNALLVEGNDFKWVWPLAILGLPILLSLFYGLSSVIYFILRGERLKWLLFVTILSLTEWTRGHIFTGFPWNLFGYAWTDINTIMQTASIGGIYFLSCLTIIWAAFPGLLFDRSTPKKIKFSVSLLIVFTVASSLTYGFIRLQKHATLFNDQIYVRIVQPNISQADKWDPNKLSENLRTLISLSADKNNKSPVTIIVWPETAISSNALKAESVQNALKETLASYEYDVFLTAGMLNSYPEEQQYFNSMVTLDRTLREISRFDKTHLVPFGEYIPFKDLIPFKPFAFYSGFTAGEGSKPTQITETFYYNPLICYEILFPSEMITATNLTKSSAIINATNDAWYGDSSGPRQHFAMAQYRAIERGLPVIRVANTGISGVIDPLGRVINQIPLMQQSAVTAPLPHSLTERTIYDRYKELPYFLVVLMLLAVLFKDPETVVNRRKI